MNIKYEVPNGNLIIFLLNIENIEFLNKLWMLGWLATNMYTHKWKCATLVIVISNETNKLSKSPTKDDFFVV